MMKCRFKLISSLEKVFFKEEQEAEELVRGSMMKNEIYSFQLVALVHHETEQNIKCRVEVISELAPYVAIRQVGYVPSLLPTIEIDDDNDYLSKTPGLFPDPLYRLKNGELQLANNQLRSFWVSVEPRGEITGIYPIKFRIYDDLGRCIKELCFTLEILDVNLPEATVYTTGWFHGDCIARLHHTEIFSDRYYELCQKYMEVYVRFGHNTILTPVFTPPIDTAVGGERPTNQLVDVWIEKGTYRFGFERLKGWIGLCLQCGIRYFEISHLFTQWGAEFAPKIVAEVDGVLTRIFGWETRADSEEYTGFLHAFLPTLIQFLKTEGILEKCFFHVSDEPQIQHEMQYRAAKSILSRYIDEERIIDALSEYSFYEKGIVQKPIVCNDHIHTFMEHGVKGLWTYYCMAQRKNVANRFMAMPSYRNRILGWQLYKHEIEGFVQWGFNFWFTQYSKEVLDPYQDTTAGGAFPSGDAYLVYPEDADGDVVCSLRLYVFNEGLQDMRALQLLELLEGKEAVQELLGEIQGFDSYPRNNQYILRLREAINERIKVKYGCYDAERRENNHKR